MKKRSQPPNRPTRSIYIRVGRLGEKQAPRGLITQILRRKGNLRVVLYWLRTSSAISPQDCTTCGQIVLPNCEIVLTVDK